MQGTLELSGYWTYVTGLWRCVGVLLNCVQRDCRVCGLSRDDAMVCGRWRKLIRMVDEQEGCEWMNVSSGTGSPG